MLAKRIIPCLDIKDGQTVKGTNFVNLRQAGDPVELGRTYSEQGADELVFLDITASHEGRKTFTDLVKRVAANINIPFTVGGGINELSDVDRLLNAGADKVSINSSAIRNPDLVDKIAKHFGSQVCVVAIDAKQTETGWKCYLNGGRIETDKYLFDCVSLCSAGGFENIGTLFSIVPDSLIEVLYGQYGGNIVFSCCTYKCVYTLQKDCRKLVNHEYACCLSRIVHLRHQHTANAADCR